MSWSWPLAYLYLGLVAASVAAATYGVWTARWIRRGAPFLALLNGLIAVAGIALILAHLLSLSEPIITSIRIRRTPSPLLWGDILILLPAVTRLLELRRDKKRDAVRAAIVEGIKAKRDDHSEVRRGDQ